MDRNALVARSGSGISAIFAGTSEQRSQARGRSHSSRSLLQLFSLIVSVSPPAGLDPGEIARALSADERVRGATARTPPRRNGIWLGANPALSDVAQVAALLAERGLLMRGL
jgi:hypothetical protein